MPKLHAARRRDQQRRHRRYGMQVTGRSTKSVLLRIVMEKAEKARKEKRAAE